MTYSPTIEKFYRPTFENFSAISFERFTDNTGLTVEPTAVYGQTTGELSEGFWMPVPTAHYDSGFKEYIREKIAELSELPPNWDCYGAPKIRSNIISAALRMIERLPDNIAPRPSIVPMSSGNIQFEWEFGSRALELEIETSGKVHYLKWDPERRVEEEKTYPIADIGMTVDLLNWVCGIVMNA